MGFNRHERRQVVHRHQVDDDDTDRTKQEFAEVADIRNIADRYLKTGMAPQTNREAIYGDFSNVDDYLEARNQLLAAEEAYGQLPLAIRDRFSGIPELVAFVADDANIGEALELGAISLEEARARGFTPPKLNEEAPAEAPQSTPPEGGEQPA